MKRILVLALCAWSLVLAPVVGRAQAPSQLEEAKREFDVGQTAYDLGQFDGALLHYTRAYELSKLAAILFNLGQVRRKLYEQNKDVKDLREARELYRSYLRQVPISSDRSVAESLLKEVEEEYGRILAAERDKLLAEATGIGALQLAEDFVGEGDLQAARTAVQRFVRTPGNRRAEVVRAQRVVARIEAASGNVPASRDAWARALALDPSAAPPPAAEAEAKASFDSARERLKGKKPLALQHVPPGRVKIGTAPKLQVEVASDPLSMVQSLRVSYRAGAGAYATLNAKPGELGFPSTFNAGLAPGTRIEYHVEALDEEGAVLDSLGSAALPFVVKVDDKPPIPAWKRWYFWVGLGAGALVAAGAAAAIGVTQAPPDRVPIPVTSGLQVR